MAKNESLDTKAGIPEIDGEAFEKGRQFLDGIKGELRNFNGYPGIRHPGPKFPHVEEVSIEIKPYPGESLFFKINGGPTSVQHQQFSLDGHKSTRAMPQIWSPIEETEARKVQIDYKPDSGSGSEFAYIYGMFGEADPQMTYGLIAVRSIYAVRDLRLLELAIVQKDESTRE